MWTVRSHRVIGGRLGARLAVCLWQWLRRRPPAAGEHPYHRGLWPVMVTVVALVVAEGAVTELVLALALPGTVWPWLLLALHGYGLLWLGALAASFAVRPHVLDQDSFVARDGVLAEVVVPRAAIRGARRAHTGGWTRSGLVVDADGHARLTHPGPAVTLELDPDSPVRLARPAATRTLRSLTITVDDPDRLLRALTR